MALISHIPASELAFEIDNHKFLISEIIDFLDKKKHLAFFDILSIYNTPHDF